MTGVSQTDPNAVAERLTWRHADTPMILNNLIETAVSNLAYLRQSGNYDIFNGPDGNVGPATVREFHRIGLKTPRQIGSTHGLQAVVRPGDWVVYKDSTMREYAEQQHQLRKRGVYALTIFHFMEMAKAGNKTLATPRCVFVDESYFAYKRRRNDAESFYRAVLKIFPITPIVVELD